MRRRAYQASSTAHQLVGTDPPRVSLHRGYRHACPRFDRRLSCVYENGWIALRCMLAQRLAAQGEGEDGTEIDKVRT